MMRTPLILNLAPTGMVPTRAMSPHVPLQPAEVVRDVLAAADVGITIAHLHARDEDGTPTHRRETYARMIGPIRERRPDLVICVSCSGRLATAIEDRADVLALDGDLTPDMASLTLSSLNFAKQASVNAPEVVRELAVRMRERGIRPEAEVFDLGMVNVLRYLLDRGVLGAPVYANVLVGNVAGAQADLGDMAAVVTKLPAGTIWSLAGLGAAQLPVAAVAAGLAPGVRIGLEDNLWLDEARTEPATNPALVERVHRLADAAGRAVMSAAELRTRLGMARRS
jgi:3-keto-5-aminohexanoate cleavage enzyme